MTAVVAEAARHQRCPDGSAEFRTLDLWADLAATVDRAGGDPDRLWVDDSKAILRGGKGRDRLVAACLATVHAVCDERPSSLSQLLGALGAGTPEDAELALWSCATSTGSSGPRLETSTRLDRILESRPLEPRSASWRLAAVRSVVVAPARFNAGLKDADTKAEVHFAAFARLARTVWDRAADGVFTFVNADKHGGKHYYLPELCAAFPDAWIDRGSEGAELSRYTIRCQGRVVELTLRPRADQQDGLVALASIVSKTVRELWMDVFNDYWRARVPGLRPTAGYPVDAQRFRTAIEAAALAAGHDPSLWWRLK
jgi:hypothetical protein